jgi:hypothetical protein
MNLTHLPEPWRADAVYRLGDRATIHDEHRVYVLRCERGGKAGLRPPKLPATIITRSQDHHETAIIKLYDAQCE